MEPARGECGDWTILIQGHGIHDPQWSPLAVSGMTDALTEPITWTLEPQWSPPLNGGITRHDDRAVAGLLGAAMEPAAERRDYGQAPGGDDLLDRAAMEPAAERRDPLLHPGVVADPVGAAMEPAAERREPRPRSRSGDGSSM